VRRTDRYDFNGIPSVLTLLGSPRAWPILMVAAWAGFAPASAMLKENHRG
jgi:hypothetical protein